MSTVSDVSSLTNNSSPAKSKTGTEDIQQRFLTLLVTQIQNQDPLNPMDNAQVTTQLAQLNTVSGIDQLNTTLKAMAAGFTASQTLQAASMVGRDVMVAGDQAELAYSGNAGTALFGAQLAQPVDSLRVSIYDQAGKLVHVDDAGPQQAGVIALHWDGSADAGGTAPQGKYRIVLSAAAGGKPVDAAALAVHRVTSVSAGPAGAQLNFGHAGSAPVADVKQII